jgi:hypothetical protein
MPHLVRASTNLDQDGEQDEEEEWGGQTPVDDGRQTPGHIGRPVSRGPRKQREVMAVVVGGCRRPASAAAAGGGGGGVGIEGVNLFLGENK